MDEKLRFEALKAIICGPARKMVIVTHTNPDGDAIGSTLAWAEVLEHLGHTVTCMVPNRYPSFLDWMDGIGRMIIAKDHSDEVTAAIADAEAIFVMDLNNIERLDSMSAAIEANTTAERILIDHHLSPPDRFNLQFSYPHLCSTAYITFNLIVEVLGEKFITKPIAENLYAGIMTDTGNFAFSYLTPDLMRAVAVLLERGLDIPKVHTAVYSSYSEGRVRLLGYSLCNKMTVLQHGKAAFISLSESEMRRFSFQLGDSEGFVNYPLTIVGVKIAALFIETRKFVRVSLRSRGNEVDVNLFARRYFGGGGHKNAAGGKSFVSLKDTADNFRRAVAEYFAEHPEL